MEWIVSTEEKMTFRVHDPIIGGETGFWIEVQDANDLLAVAALCIPLTGYGSREEAEAAYARICSKGDDFRMEQAERRALLEGDGIQLVDE